MHPSIGKLREDGKLYLNDIYGDDAPVNYYAKLAKLDYCLTDNARGVFQRIFAAYRAARNVRRLRVLDVGCSYGVNALELKAGWTFQELAEHYQTSARSVRSVSEMIARDRVTLLRSDADPELQFIGLDTQKPAIDYADMADIIESGAVVNLEKRPPSPQDAETLSGVDLVISTGCVGYVTERTLCTLADLNEERRPWFAHFVLRMYPYRAVQQSFAARGYVTLAAPHTVRQRRFATENERERVLDRLVSLGIDPSGRETTGWFHARLYLSRPAEDIDRPALDGLFPPIA